MPGSRTTARRQSSPTPSAQVTAALIGDTCDTITTVSCRAASDSSTERRLDPPAQCRQRLATRRGEVRVRAPLRPHRRGHLGRAACRRSRRSRARGAARRSTAARRTRRRSGACAVSGLVTTRSTGPTAATSACGLGGAELVEGHVEPSEQQPAGVGLGAPVAHDDQRTATHRTSVPVEVAGAQEEAAVGGVGPAEGPPAPDQRGRCRSASSTTSTGSPRCSSGSPPSGKAHPKKGHQNTALDVHDPSSTSADHQPDRQADQPATQQPAVLGGEHHDAEQHDAEGQRVQQARAAEDGLRRAGGSSRP